MPDTYDYITLLCRLKAAQTRIKELESGERYIHLQELHQKEYMAYERKLRRLTQDLAAAHRETIRVRNYWFQVLEDMQRELEQAKRKAEQELKKWKSVHWMLKNSGMMHWIKQKRSVCSIMKQLLNWKKNGEKPETACTDQS